MLSNPNPNPNPKTRSVRVGKAGGTPIGPWGKEGGGKSAPRARLIQTCKCESIYRVPATGVLVNVKPEAKWTKTIQLGRLDANRSRLRQFIFLKIYRGAYTRERSGERGFSNGEIRTS